MSANNFILISKSNYTVKVCDADSKYCSLKYTGADLEDAIQKAQDIMQEDDIEYGIHFEE